MDSPTAQPTAPTSAYASDLQGYNPDVLSVDASAWKFLLRHPFHLLFAYIVPVCAAVAIAGAEYIALSSAAAPSTDLRGPVTLVLLPLLIPVISYWRVRAKMQQLFYTELAALLKCSYSPTGYVANMGQLFTYGYGHSVSNVFMGTYRGQPYRLYDYEYVTGSGKTRESHFYTVGELTTSATLPHILGTPAHWYSFALSWQPAGTEPLELEGGFSEKFRVYVDKNAQVESREIFEPTVMEQLMQGYDAYSFECVGSSVYLFTRGAMAETRGAVLGAYTLLQRFSGVISPELEAFAQEQPSA